MTDWLGDEPILDGRESLRRGAEHCAVELGWRLVPMEHRTKLPHPVLLPGRTLRHRRDKPTTAKEIRSWIQADPTLGIAVITGPCSGDLVAVDADHQEHFPPGLPVPPSPQVATPRGFRAFYKASGPVRSRRLPWGEILSGGLAILPPSVHPNGTCYAWSHGLAPWQVDLDELPEPYYPLFERKAVERVQVRAPLEIPKAANWLKSIDRVDGDILRGLYSDEAVVRQCADLLGIPPVAFGRAFRCILPGHEEQTPSASFYKAENGIYVYHDFHRRDGVEFLTLPEVRASCRSGRVVTLRDAKPEASVWGIRLLIEARVLRPAVAPILQLPTDAPFSAVQVAAGFNFLLACKWLYEPGAPTTFSKRFAANWCGIGEVQAWEGISGLVERGYLRFVGRHKGAPLYLPAGP